MTAKIIAFANQKGGVGKTTSAVNLAASLAQKSQQVLLIDLDPQGNASTGLGISHFQRRITIYNVFASEGTIEEAEIITDNENLKVIPSNVDLSAAEIEISGPRREFILKDKLSEAIEKYDFIILDCPPSLGLLTLNALVAANSIIVPMQCEFYALEGLSHLLKTIDLIKKNLNPALQIEGVLLTMYDKRYNLTQAVENDVREYLGNKVFTTVIPRSVRVSEAPSHGKPVVVYDKTNAGAIAYLELAGEIISRYKNIENDKMDLMKYLGSEVEDETADSVTAQSDTETQVSDASQDIDNQANNLKKEDAA